eukprot:2786484-Rhodomonas_salina.1
MDIINPPIKKPQCSRIASAAQSAISMFTPANQQLIKINCTGNDDFVALMGTLQVIALQQSYVFRALVLPPEPDWIDLEWIEMDTIYQMGTITYIPNLELPFCTTLIPTKFKYKCKFGELCEVIKMKALLCVCGDLQKDCEFTETFAPTLRFNMLRALISVAVQEKLKLVQLDIKGAFMVSPIDDKDIYISLPDSYKVPEGFTAKLSNSLYGTSDTAYRFWSTLSTWNCGHFLGRLWSYGTTVGPRPFCGCPRTD